MVIGHAVVLVVVLKVYAVKNMPLTKNNGKHLQFSQNCIQNTDGKNDYKVSSTVYIVSKHHAFAKH